MTPKQETNLQLYKSQEDLVNPLMASWVEENNSLMKDLLVQMLLRIYLL